MEERGIPFARESDLPTSSKGTPPTRGYRVDFLCFGEVIVELKAIGDVTPGDYAQVINSLKATGFSRGLLIHFGTSSLVTKCFVRSLPSASIGEIGG